MSRTTALSTPLSWLVLAATLLVGCARREPLPGDSVSQSGSVSVAPARAPAVSAERPSATAPSVREPPGAIESRVFAPELLMERQAEIGIDDKQREKILVEVERAQTEMTKRRWELEREREALAKLLDAEPVDEPAALASAKRLTDVESRIKAVHFAMLVRVKNVLTPAQKLALRRAQDAGVSPH